MTIQQEFMYKKRNLSLVKSFMNTTPSSTRSKIPIKLQQAVQQQPPIILSTKHSPNVLNLKNAYNSKSKNSLRTQTTTKLEFINDSIPKSKHSKRSQSASTDLSMSELSITSFDTSSACSFVSTSSAVLTDLNQAQNSHDLIKLVKKSLNKLEITNTIEQLYEFLSQEVKLNSYKSITLEVLEQYLVKNPPTSLPTSQLQFNHSKRSLTQLRLTSNNTTLSIYDLNGRNINKKCKIVDAYFKALRVIRNLFKASQRDLFEGVLDIDLDTIISYQRPSLKIQKYQIKLTELVKQIESLLNDKKTCDLNILSSQSKLPAKLEYYKQGEYVLRLINDLVHKIKICLKLYSKIVSLNLNSPVAEGVSKSKLPKIEAKFLKIKTRDAVDQGPFGYSNRTNTSNTTNEPIYKRPGARTAVIKLLKEEDLKNDSFIQETDCKSLSSDDDSIEKELDKSDLSDLSIGNQMKDKKFISDDYKNLKEKIRLVNADITDLNRYLNTLSIRAERCALLEEQLRADQELIRKTETSLKLCSKAEKSFRLHLEKQLDYLKYRFKLNLQDLSIEHMCAPEIYSAISDSEFKLIKLNSYLQDLSMNLVFIESKLNLNQFKNSNSSKLKSHNHQHYQYQNTLPPIQNQQYAMF